MHRGSYFWGIVLILAGAAFLLGNLFGVDAWKLIVPGALILFGVWVLLGAALAPRVSIVQNVRIPDEGAAKGRLIIRHAAGVLRIGSGAGPGEFISGEFSGGVTHSTRRDGDTLHADLRVPVDDTFWLAGSWARSRGFTWTLRLSNALPFSLRVESGASEAHLDLTELQVTGLEISTGASSTSVHLPAHAGLTQVHIEAGAASVRVVVPEGVAASILATGALSERRIDRARFPLTGARYQSPGFDTAVNKAEISIQTGVGSVEVR